jgi:hypothetical protein
MTTELLEEVEAEISRIFPRALVALVDELDRRYNDGVAPLDREADGLVVEYAAITAEAEKLSAVLPALGREAQREADRLVLAGDQSAAGVKLAEMQEAEKLPIEMQKRQREISDRYDLIPGEKVAVAQNVYEQMYPEMQALVRTAETAFFVRLLDGLARAAEDFQQKTGSAQNPILQLNRMSALTADAKSPEWQSAQRWY